MAQDTAQIMMRGRYARLVMRGRYARIVMRGRYARLVMRGRYARIVMRGRHARIIMRGRCARIGMRGRYARIVVRGRHTLRCSIVLVRLTCAQVKGQAEEAVKAGGFPFVSVFRPGLIDRGDRMRGGEKLAKVLGVSSIKTAAFGKLMVEDAEEVAQGRRTPAVAMFRMKAMQEAAKAGVPPKHSGK
eukprot:366456-Chlamydomonas_euryale.AAC.18